MIKRVCTIVEFLAEQKLSAFFQSTFQSEILFHLVVFNFYSNDSISNEMFHFCLPY
jgi:hypothetical protein